MCSMEIDDDPLPDRDWDELALALDEDLRREIAAARAVPKSEYTPLDDIE
jgi:hypothetical protein